MHELTICTFSITKSTDKTLKIILAKLSKIVLKIDISTSIFLPLLVKSESYERVLLRGIENRRDIFFMYITRCVSFARIIRRRRIKLEKEGPNERFLITHDSRLMEEEKKKDDDKKWNCTFYPSQLALNSWSELWVTLSTTCSALRVTGRTLLVFDWQSDYSSSGFDSEATTSIQRLCFTTPEM